MEEEEEEMEQVVSVNDIARAYFKAPLVGAIAVELREEGGAFKQGDTQVHAEPWLPSRKAQFQHRYPLRERHPGNGSRRRLHLLDPVLLRG